MIEHWPTVTVNGFIRWEIMMLLSADDVVSFRDSHANYPSFHTFRNVGRYIDQDIGNKIELNIAAAAAISFADNVCRTVKINYVTEELTGTRSETFDLLHSLQCIGHDLVLKRLRFTVSLTGNVLQ
jgi:hypothetical protein